MHSEMISQVSYASQIYKDSQMIARESFQNTIYRYWDDSIVLRGFLNTHVPCAEHLGKVSTFKCCSALFLQISSSFSSSSSSSSFPARLALLALASSSLLSLHHSPSFAEAAAAVPANLFQVASSEYPPKDVAISRAV